MTKTSIYDLVQNNLFIVTDKVTLQQKISDKKPFTLTEYIDYCYHTISQIKDDPNKLKNQQVLSSIEKINTHPIQLTPQKKPCFIYEHLFETFCSLAEADQDDDKELVRCQIEEIEECIGIYWGREENRKSEYQDLAEVEVKQLIQSDQLKQLTFKQLKLLVDELKNQTRQSIPPQSSKFSHKPKNQIKKKAEDWLNKRKEERAIIFGRIKGNAGAGVEEREKFLVGHYLEEILK